MPANVPHWDFNALPVNAKLHLQRDPMYAEKRHIEQSFRSLKMLIGLAEDVSFPTTFVSHNQRKLTKILL